jgi:hypothetical protein
LPCVGFTIGELALLQFSMLSHEHDGYGHNPGFKRGVRIGNAETGEVRAFLKDDPESNPEKSGTTMGEGVYADKNGVVYVAEVARRPWWYSSRMACRRRPTNVKRGAWAAPFCFSAPSSAPSFRDSARPPP